jgi:hypothetical protein
MTTIITREVGAAAKGSPLTNAEVDTNFINLNDNKVEINSDALLNSVKLGTGTNNEGKLSWNSSDSTVDLVMRGGLVVQQIGEEQFYTVRNQTGTTISAGTPVYANGVTSGSARITVAPAIADGTIPSRRYVGIAAESISSGINGYVTSFGYVRNIDTRGTVQGETWAVGDLLYVSQTNAGKLTNIEPTSGLMLPVGIIIVRHQTTGIILTRSSPAISATAEQGVLASNSVQRTGDESIAGNKEFTGTITISELTGLRIPQNASDAASKQYVDQTAEGLLSKPSVRAATNSNLSATYDNGVAGVGATLTATANGSFPLIDDVQLSTTNGDRGLLVRAQTDAAHNGRYNLTNAGSASTPWVLTKCGLCDEAEEIPGSYTFVQAGTQFGGSGWVQTVTDPSTFTVGTDAVIVIQFSGAGTYTAGTGLSLVGNQFSVSDTGVVYGSYGSSMEIPAITVNSQGQITGITTNTVTAVQAGDLSTVATTGNYSDLIGAPDPLSAAIAMAIALG